MPFVDENGRDVTLRQYVGARPVVLALVYYECPMLCIQVLNGLSGSLQALSFSASREFDVVAVSFDPGETPALAAERRRDFLSRYRRDCSSFAPTRRSCCFAFDRRCRNVRRLAGIEPDSELK